VSGGLSLEIIFIATFFVYKRQRIMKEGNFMALLNETDICG